MAGGLRGGLRLPRSEAARGRRSHPVTAAGPGAEEKKRKLTAQAAWREAVQVLLERERQVPWWRRWSSPDGTGSAWAGESLFTAE